jgi:hypothetical protein
MRSLGTYRPLTPAMMEMLEELVRDRDGRCYFADTKHRYDHDCTGRTWAAHLYPQSGLKKIYRYGAWTREGDGYWRPMEPYTPEASDRHTITLADICGDARNAVAMCDEMHKFYDDGINVRRKCFALLPEAFTPFMREYRLEAQIERYFGLEPFSLEAV